MCTCVAVCWECAKRSACTQAADRVGRVHGYACARRARPVVCLRTEQVGMVRRVKGLSAILPRRAVFELYNHVNNRQMACARPGTRSVDRLFRRCPSYYKEVHTHGIACRRGLVATVRNRKSTRHRAVAPLWPPCRRLVEPQWLHISRSIAVHLGPRLACEYGERLEGDQPERPPRRFRQHGDLVFRAAPSGWPAARGS